MQASTTPAAPAPSALPFDKRLLWERNLLFVGQEMFFGKIQKTHCTVIGCGGVGSAVAHCLVRSGIERIRLIDSKEIVPSSLNRHVCAMWADIGRPKVEVLKEFFLRFNPDVQCEAINCFFVADAHGQEILKGTDWVIDCIDDINTVWDFFPIFWANGAGGDILRIQKTALLKYCVENHIKVVRRRLAREGIYTGITCVYSTEAPLAPLAPLSPEQLAAIHERRAREAAARAGPQPTEVDEGEEDAGEKAAGAADKPIQKVHLIITFCAFSSPIAIIGNAAAAVVIMNICGYANGSPAPRQPLTSSAAAGTVASSGPSSAAPAVVPLTPAAQAQAATRAQKERLRALARDALSREMALFRYMKSLSQKGQWPGRVPEPQTQWINAESMRWVADTAWKGRSALAAAAPTADVSATPAVAPAPATATAVPTAEPPLMCVVRWDARLPFGPSNAVLLTPEEGYTHRQRVATPLEVLYGPETVARVAATLNRELKSAPAQALKQPRKKERVDVAREEQTCCAAVAATTPMAVEGAEGEEAEGRVLPQRRPASPQA
ncbi:putative tRNA threonylcarbamoyladenosine dehydratase 2 [Paratrimastix pyriformis]|uniref:tRNA threonylcarbamoyladenosine dehydratase 2 n=1 Tax=Paratrimastix pyriformis TaxID=342808 RepID=A0ABQ8UP67_9EUKA|nr:putative tRNA threonylcarbamoyladenosine dehydratase 2 [Paratrimastix pyriformis]